MKQKRERRRAPPSRLITALPAMEWPDRIIGLPTGLGLLALILIRGPFDHDQLAGPHRPGRLLAAIRPRQRPFLVSINLHRAPSLLLLFTASSSKGTARLKARHVFMHLACNSQGRLAGRSVGRSSRPCQDGVVSPKARQLDAVTRWSCMLHRLCKPHRGRFYATAY